MRKTDLPTRPFRRAESDSAVPIEQHATTTSHAESIRLSHDYTKRPALASHVLKGSTGGYSRNAHRHDDEKKYLVRRRRVLYLLPVMAFFVVVGVALWGPFVSRPQILSAQQTNLVDESAQPSVVPLAGSSDEKPAANYLETYKTAPTSPKLLSIDSLGIQARVLEVGLDGRNQPQLPKNSYDAGWYNVSALPGKAGAMVLSGACSGSVGQGVFHRLGELKHGELIRITRGDGVSYEYSVEYIETVTVEKVPMTDALVPANRVAEGLNLIGCTGKYDVKTNDFAERTIVYAVRI